MPGKGKMWFTNIIFAREQKCLINHLGLGFRRRNGSDKHNFCLGKILHQYFSP
jgi:hypothetical protein